MTPRHTAITNAHLDTIRAAIAADGPPAGLIAMWGILEPRWKEITGEGAISPSDYTITQADFQRIMHVFYEYKGPYTNGGTDADYRTCLLMEWLNRGPATVEAPEAKAPDRPEPFKQYHLTGKRSIAAGNTWAESIVKD